MGWVNKHHPSDDCEISPVAVGQSVCPQSACCEAHNAHGQRPALLCTKLECNLEKSYITLHLRSEGNTCQLDRFVIRIKYDNIHMCVF